MSVSISDLSKEIMKELNTYNTSVTTEIKKSVRKSGNAVKKDIRENAPRRTGKYAESWITTTVSESSSNLTLAVHSRNRYRLAHLLEFGHANRGGGRTKGYPHIAKAEKEGAKILEEAVKKALEG